MKIGGIQKTSLIDYPDKISAIVFTLGCNFRCGYCHNSELVFQENPAQSESDFLEFLKTRIGKLDAVVITGGEPCLQPDLKDFIKKIKQLGFLVKLDTNGTFPKTIKELLEESLLDYIAMDIKAPLEKYEKITKTPSDTQKTKESISLIMNSGVDYEFRTTVIKSQLNFEDFKKIRETIKGAQRYYLQKFIPSKILDKTLEKEESYTADEFTPIVNMLKEKIKEVSSR